MLDYATTVVIGIVFETLLAKKQNPHAAFFINCTDTSSQHPANTFLPEKTLCGHTA